MASSKEPNVLISWSGPLSLELATELRKWLPLVVGDAVPWVSSEDIQKGAGWPSELNNALALCKCSVVVLTESNRTSPWILFEAGAIFKALPTNRLFTVLCDLVPSQIPGPLTQFQATPFEKTEMLKFCRSISMTLIDEIDARLDTHFETYWPKLETAGTQALKRHHNATPPTPEPDAQSIVSEEILTTVRELRRAQLVMNERIRLIDERAQAAPPSAPVAEGLFGVHDEPRTLRLSRAAMTKFSEASPDARDSIRADMIFVGTLLRKDPGLWRNVSFVDGDNWRFHISMVHGTTKPIFIVDEFQSKSL